MSDTGAQDYEDDDLEDVALDEDDEERNRKFFGDEEYTILSSVPEEEVEHLSMTL